MNAGDVPLAVFAGANDASAGSSTDVFFPSPHTTMGTYILDGQPVIVYVKPIGAAEWRGPIEIEPRENTHGPHVYEIRDVWCE